MSFYPSATHFYSDTNKQRPIFQGDIFQAALAAFWPHPETVRAHRANKPAPISPEFPTTSDLIHEVRIEGTFAMLLPHPCDFSEDEKGSTHPMRLVAPIIPASKLNVPLKIVRSGNVGHLIWVPRWKTTGEEDWAVNLRWMTSIDSTFLQRENRVAALSVSAWIAINDKLTRYFTGAAIDRITFAIERADLHPDHAKV